MAGAPARVARRLVDANNRRIERIDRGAANPRSLEGCEWHRALVDAFPTIEAEWSSFAGAGARLPLIEEVMGEGQGNIGPWRIGLLVLDGRPVPYAPEWFPATVDALAAVPGLRAALWSVIEPGTELTMHRGPDAGVLRYHLGVDCPPGSSLRVGDEFVEYRTGRGILFDDTAPHAAWNRSDHDRVTLFLEVERPLPTLAALANRATRRLLRLGRARSRSRRLAVEWHLALNAGLAPTGPAAA